MILWDVVNCNTGRVRQTRHLGGRNFTRRNVFPPCLEVTRDIHLAAARIFRYSMQLKAEEFCILITNRTPSSGQPPLEERIVRVRARIRTCIYIHICVTWGFHAGISICKQGSILSSVALCKDSGSRARRRRSSSIGERRWVDIRENGVNASFQRSVNFLIEKLAPLVGKFPVGTVYTRGNCSSALRIVRLSFYSKFLDDDCHIIKLNNVITV